ncbi:MAG: Rrf2 family transcriptional regulator [Oceanococcus sp.]
MNVTSRGRYAVTALLDLAQHGHGGPVPLAEVARRQELSQRYLEQIFCGLRACGLVESVRGAGGGYRLCRAPENISVAEVVAAVDAHKATQDTAGPAHQNLVTEFWSGLSDCMRHYLEEASLASLCDCAARGEQSCAPNRTTV